MPSGGDRSGAPARLRRRRFLAGVTSAILTAGAGCNQGGSSSTPSPTDTEAFVDRPIEVLHGWTGGDGGQAIRSVERMFRARHPDVSLDLRPVGGTGNENLNSAINRRLMNDNPPSSFATWPGPTLVRYEGELLDVSGTWKTEAFTETIHPRVAQYCKFNGGYRAVPIGAHRLNTFFYRVETLQSAGVDPTELTSVKTLEAAFETIDRETDVVPLAHAMQAPWTNLQLVGQTLLAQSDPDEYRQFVSGTVNRATLRRALETTKAILEQYINEDASVISFTEANRKFIRGEAAAIYQGSWVYGMYRNADSHEFGRDWEWIPFPGTGDSYVANLDSFTFPRDNPTPQKKDVWATFVGQSDPQIAFSNRKGSVPVRTDFDGDRLAAFPRVLWRDLQNADQLLPSLAHGLAVDPQKLRACKSVIRDHFMEPFDVEQTADGLLAALEK
ncbi:MAG: ABC transporter substrate-binding protein [Halobacteriales archaeon]